MQTKNQSTTSCPVVTEFWNSLKTWLQQTFGLYLELNPQLIIFGVLENDLDFFPKNCIILTAKKFIFDSAKNYKVLNLNRFRGYFKSTFSENPLGKSSGVLS